jgi:hypothetical protein
MASLVLTSFSNIVQSEITGEVEKVLWEDGGKIISCKFSCCILWYHYFPRSRSSFFFFFVIANCILSDTGKLYPRRRLLNLTLCFSVGNLVVVCI